MKHGLLKWGAVPGASDNGGSRWRDNTSGTLARRKCHRDQSGDCDGASKRRRYRDAIRPWIGPDRAARRGQIPALHEPPGDDPVEPRGLDANGATAWTAALYARYSLTDRVYLATRGEYLHSDDGTLGFSDSLVPWPNSNASIDENNVYVTNADLYSFTLTAGFAPCECLLLRAEYRLDIASSDGGDDGERNIFGNNRTDQHMFAVDAVYKFW
jgi:hypothetical protein